MSFDMYYLSQLQKIYTGYFTSDNEPGGIENATHNTLERKPGHGGDKNIRLFLLMYCGLHVLFRRAHYHS
jgi:ABC-type phosphate transport system substrate-binding protein